MNPEDKSAAGDREDVVEASTRPSSPGGTDRPEGHGPFAPPEEIASLREQPGAEGSAEPPGVLLPHAGLSPAGEAPLGPGPATEPGGEVDGQDPDRRGGQTQSAFESEAAPASPGDAFAAGDAETLFSAGRGPIDGGEPETRAGTAPRHAADLPADPAVDSMAGGWSDPLQPYPAGQLPEPDYSEQDGALEAADATAAGVHGGEVWDDGYAVEDAESEARTEGPGTGPNWMMAFVCLWAAGTSLYEAWLVGAPAGFRRAVLMTPEFGGYALLGLGLLGFACESLIWNRGRRRGLLRYGGGHLVLILAGLGLVLAGAALLFLSRDPGRRI